MGTVFRSDSVWLRICLVWILHDLPPFPPVPFFRHGILFIEKEKAVLPKKENGREKGAERSVPFLKFCPKSKRALRISSSYLAEPVQKAYQRVFASMELLKIVLTFYPRESNNYPANSQCLPAKITLDANTVL